MAATLFRALLLLPLLTPSHAQDIDTLPILPTGNASVTHYDLPLGGYVAACGCGGNSSYYPTAALSQAAYGSSISAGPACGQCFNLTLVRAFVATPEFVIEERGRPWIVVKITDKCPALPLYDPDRTWCGARKGKTNRGVSLHFDLASPSPMIPASFFPAPNANYGYSEFGAWMATYEKVSCTTWAGYTNETASIVDPSLANTSACCPLDPLSTVNGTCDATSLRVGSARREGLSVLVCILLGMVQMVLL